MKYIDLSYEIVNEMPAYPGDDNASINKIKDYGVDGYCSYSFIGQMHLGTHIDSPMHLTESNKYISEYPIERFIGNAVLLDVRNEKEIDLKDEYYKLIKENDIVLLYTGFDSNYGTVEYYENHPVITERLAEFLVRKKIKMVGIDMPSPDREPFNIHKMLLNNEIFILENITNLSKLLYVEDIVVYAQPLKIQAEASLVRAFACYQGY